MWIMNFIDLTLTLVLKLDLDIVKMYMCTKDETPTSNGSKVVAWTDTQTDGQTHTNATEIITYLHTQMVIKDRVVIWFT